MTNVAIGCLFVATMYQLSYAIQMIDNPMCDLEKLNKRKCCVYTVAGASFCIFAVIVITLMVIQGIDKEQQDGVEYIMTLSYLLLPIAYIFTLCQLNKALNGLYKDSIRTERSSVMKQFVLFIVSYITRFIFELVLLTFFENKEGLVFGWQLTLILMYLPWYILPTGYILLCHQRTYKNT